MSDTPIFEITTSHLNTGLRGFPVGTVRTSRVDPQAGVSYVGRPIGELAELDPEAVIFLLLNKRLPSKSELSSFKSDLGARSAVNAQVLSVLKMLPKEGHPMEWFITGLNLLGMTGKSSDNNYMEDAMNAMARIPTVVAAVFRLRSGWGDIIEPKPELGLVENFVHMLGVPNGDNEALTQLLRTFYILHMDHGGGNLSTFTGKAVASGHADLYASLSAAMCGLYGPLHGRANQDCLNFVRSVGTSDPAELDAKLTELLKNGEKIYGFGHAVLRVEDPRATVQYELGKKICPNDPLFKTAVAMRELAVSVIKREKPRVQSPYPNVDAVSGTLLNASGLTDSDYYTVLFGLARCSGIAAQIVDERSATLWNARKNRPGPVPIYRCSYKFEAVEVPDAPATSHYKQIDGVKYSRALLELTDELVAGKGDGRISIEDANAIFDKLKNDGKYTDLEKRTIAYIRDQYNFTDSANEHLRTQVRSWAAERGHKN